MAVEEPAGANWWNRLRTQTGFESQEEEPQTLLQQIDEATTLSRMQARKEDLDLSQNFSCQTLSNTSSRLCSLQRIYGFAVCLGIGLAFGFLVSGCP